MSDITNAFKQAAAQQLEDIKRANPYQWTTLNLGKLMPTAWVNNTRSTITSLNGQIDKKQGQVNSLVQDTLNVVNQIDTLSGDLKLLQKDVGNYLNNLFNSGAYYRIIGFDREISNNGELDRELKRVLNPAIFGSSGTNPDPNFPNFVGDTARVGGFALLFAAPSLDKIALSFKGIGKYFPGLGEGYLGGKQAFVDSVKATKDKFKKLGQVKINLSAQFDDFKKNNQKLLDLQAQLDGLKTITDTDRWHALSLAQLIPALNPMINGSPASIALDSINESFNQAQNLLGVVDGARTAINKLNEDIQRIQQTVDAAQKFVTDIVEGVFNTGIYFHAYGSEYNLHTPLDFGDSIVNSVNDASDPNRPTFEGDTSFVGGIIALVGGPDAKGFDDSFKSFSNTFKAIGLASDSWGQSFDNLTTFKPESQKKAAAVAVVPANTQTPVTQVSSALLKDLSSKTLVSDPVPSSAVVKGFLIKNSDIPPVSAGESVQYTSANNITVSTQADIKGKITVTIIDDNIVTVKRPSNEFVATNQSQITSVVKGSTVINYFVGEQLARDDGSVSKETGVSISVFFPDGSISQIKQDGSSSTTQADGTIITVTSSGTKTERFPTGVVRKYDRNGNLVEETGPDDSKTNQETSSGKTVYLSDGSIEYTAPDGTITITKVEANGTKTITKTTTDGTQTVTKADGTVITTTLTERTTAFTDGRKTIEPIESYDTYGITFTGDITYVETNGTQRKVKVDTTQEITLPDGTVTTILPDGSSSTVRPDGTTRNVGIDGTITEIKKDGTKIITSTNGQIQQIKPDGSFVIIRPDGSVETGTQEGQVVAQAADGSIQLMKTAVLEIRRQADGAIEKDNSATGQTVIITPVKITTTQEDGTIVEVTDTQRKTTDPDGNVIIEVTSIEVDAEATRDVVYKVTKTTTINTLQQQSVVISKEAIGDIVNVVTADGLSQRLKIPAIRKVTDKNLTTVSNFNDFFYVIFPAIEGVHTVLSTNKKSGEVTVLKLKSGELSSLSIDNLNEFDE